MYKNSAGGTSPRDYARKILALSRSIGFTIILVLAMHPSYAQTGDKTARATRPQIEAMLKKDPRLERGFDLSNNTSAKVTKIVDGGVVMHLRSPAGTADVTVVGPPEVIEMGTLGQLGLAALDAGLKIYEGLKKALGGGGGGGGGGTTQTGCINISGSNNVVIVNGPICPA
jgi:hypothetical protein